MKKTFLAVVMLIFLVSLCGADKAYAISAKRAEKKIQKAQAVIRHWQSFGYYVPATEKILEQAKEAFPSGNYKEVKRLAKKAEKALKKEIKFGTITNYDFSKIKRVAVLPFGREGAVSDIFASSLTALDKFEVVERYQLEHILNEHRLNLFGLVDPETAKEIGKLTGIDALFIGSFFDHSGFFFVATSDFAHGGTQYSATINIRLVDIETGEIIWSMTRSRSGRHTSPALGIRRIISDIVLELMKVLDKQELKN